MRSDDDGFASRQVASSTLLTNASLVSPVPYRTEVFDVSKFASVAFYVEVIAGAVFPCYVTVEWWQDRAMSLGVIARDVVSWNAAGAQRNRIWNGQIACRSDFMAITFDSTAGSVALSVTGSSRVVDGIQQQVPVAIAGGPPLGLLYTGVEVVPAASNGANWYTPPWFGEVDVISYSVGASAAGSYVIIDQFVNGPDASAWSFPLNNTGGSYTVAGNVYNRARLPAVGNQFRLRHVNLDAAPKTFVSIVQPVL